MLWWHRMSWRNLFRARSRETYVLKVEIDQEEDGRIIADVVDLPGVMAYGATKQEALNKAAALALRVLAERLEREEVSASPHMTLSLDARECLVQR